MRAIVKRQALMFEIDSDGDEYSACSIGAGVEQIQLLLGHSSLQVTEVYLRSRQDIQHAVNDSILKIRN